MRAHRLTSIVIFMFVVSCSIRDNHIRLPKSDFTNFSLSKHTTSYFIYVDQISQKEFRIIDNDTLIIELDSASHSTINSLHNLRGSHDYPKIILALDKELPYDHFHNLTKEFRKVFNQSFVLKLQGQKDLIIQLPPYIQHSSEYIEEDLRGKGAPNYYPDLKSYFLEKKVLNLKVNKHEIQITDSNSSIISDLKKFLITHEKVLILTEFSIDSNYQDYVKMISFLKSSFAEIIQKEKSENKLTEQEIREYYRFIIEDKNTVLKHIQLINQPSKIYYQ